MLIDGENIDATLGTSILGRRPRPEERPRWERLLQFARERWDQPAQGLFFLAANSELPMTFVQALLAIGYRPVPLSGGRARRSSTSPIQRTLVELGRREADVMLVSNDGDFVEQVGDLLDGRRVGVIGFVEFRNSAFVPLAERGLESFDLEYDVQAFNERLPRVRIIPIDEFDPAQLPLAGRSMPRSGAGLGVARRSGSSAPGPSPGSSGVCPDSSIQPITASDATHSGQPRAIFADPEPRHLGSEVERHHDRQAHGVHPDEHPGQPGAHAHHAAVAPPGERVLLRARVTGADDEADGRPPGRRPTPGSPRGRPALVRMPGRNAASARPDRTAKNAAIAVAKTAPATCESDECCTTRTTASTTATASAAPAAILTSCCHVQNATKTTVGRAVSIDPRHPPRAVDEPVPDERLDRLGSRRGRPPRRAPPSRAWHDLVGRVEDRRRAAHRGDPAAGAQEDPGLDAADGASPDPDQVDRPVAVPDLGHQGRDAAPRRQGHRAHGAADAGRMP